MHEMLCIIISALFASAIIQTFLFQGSAGQKEGEKCNYNYLTLAHNRIKTI